jgi:hypothetical protein
MSEIKYSLVTKERNSAPSRVLEVMWEEIWPIRSVRIVGLGDGVRSKEVIDEVWKWPICGRICSLTCLVYLLHQYYY